MYLIKTNKSPFYQVMYKKNGKWTSKSSGETIKSRAFIFLSEFKENLTRQPNLIPHTIESFKDEYIEQKKTTHTKSYIRSIKYSFSELIKFAGNIRLDYVDVRTAENFIFETFQKSYHAAALHHRTLKAAFSKAIFWEYVSENPFKKIKSPKIPIKLPVFINARELKQILDKTESKLFRDIFIAAFLTGARLGEILNLKWNGVDLTNQILTVKNTVEFTTKNKRERVIPINSELQIILKHRFPKVIDLKLDEFVFWKVKGVKLNNDYVSKKFKAAVRASGLDDKIHFHTLRHSFASRLVQKGVALYVVKELLGHEDLRTTQIYAHISTANLVDAVKNLSVY
ncbi:MAG: tyrosine-type recombinase/integrase [Bacteroidetes bacterium]|nr:tyrosine-type recombinase/integrase [Bacteroidota bacterium]